MEIKEAVKAIFQAKSHMIGELGNRAGTLSGKRCRLFRTADQLGGLDHLSIGGAAFFFNKPSSPGQEIINAAIDHLSSHLNNLVALENTSSHVKYFLYTTLLLAVVLLIYSFVHNDYQKF